MYTKLGRILNPKNFHHCLIIYFTKNMIHDFILRGGSGSSVGMIMVQFEDSLYQKSEVQISIRSSNSEKIFYEKKNSMIYGPTTTACTPNHLIPIDLG
jgi:hypothetical protein